MGRALRLVQWVMLALIAVPLLVSAPAQGDQVVQFLDDSPLVVSTEKEPDPIQVTVFVQEALGSTLVSLEADGAVTPFISIEPPEPQPVSQGRVDFKLIFASPLPPGEGILVASTSDGALARRSIQFKDADTPAPLVPAKITLAAWHINLNPLSRWTRVPTREVWRTSAQAEGEAQSSDVGIISAANGETGTVKLSGGELTVEGLGRAGEYIGKVDLTPGQEGGEVDLTVNIRDIPLWPMVALIVGLAVVGLLERFTTLGRPGRTLLIRLRRTQEETQEVHRSSSKAIRERLKGFTTHPLGLPLVSEPRGERLLVDSAAKRAYVEWLGAVEEDERGEWKVGGDRWKDFRKYAEDYLALLEVLDQTAERYVDARKHAARLGLEEAANDSPVLRQYLELLDDSEIQSAEGLSRSVNDAGKAFENVKMLGSHLEGLVHLQTTTSDPNHQRRIHELAELVLASLAAQLENRGKQIKELWEEIIKPHRRELTLEDIFSVEPSEPIIDPARSSSGIDWRWPYVFSYQADDYRAGQRAARGHQIFRVPRQGPIVIAGDEWVARLLVEKGASPLPNLPEGEKPLWLSGLPIPLEGFALEEVDRVEAGPGDEVELRLDKSSQDLSNDLKKEEGRYRKFGWMLTVVGGLALLYFPNAAFGSFADYLAIFLWGTAFGTGTAVARQYITAPK